jgi:hypothetical protein
MVIVNNLVSLPDVFSAFTVNVKVPSTVGLPERTPCGDNVSPAGNAVVANHVMLPPVAVSDWLYDNPTMPSGNVSVVITGVAAVVVTVISKIALAGWAELERIAALCIVTV